MTNNSITIESCVVRNTAGRKGRTRAVSPDKTASRHLHYGRIILDAEDAPIIFANGEQETALICLKGGATIQTAGSSFELTKYDALYIPRDENIGVQPSADGCDLAEISAPVESRYPAQFVSYREVQNDPGLHF